VRHCPSCGEENTERARFCSGCGIPLEGEAAESRENRKVVSIVFCDLVGSTSMGESLDSEAVRRVMLRYAAEMRVAIERHGGRVEKFIGDAVMAVFGIPMIHEDDALRAVRAAVEMRESLGRLNDELEERWGVRLQTRSGVNTGEVVAGSDASRGEGLVVGDTVNVAARLEQHAGTNEILIGEGTYALTRDAVTAEPVEPLTLKGKAEPVPAFRLIDVSKEAPGVARRLDSPLVGREAEVDQLTDAFEGALETRECALCTIVGPAGVGKSRVSLEFLNKVADRATVLQGRCLSYGEGITYWPVAEVVREAASIRDDDSPERARVRIARLLPEEQQSMAEPVASALGLADNVFQPDEIFLAIRRLLQAIASDRPLVVVFEDIHWGEVTFFDLIEYIANSSRDAPILILCIARPELREARPEFGVSTRHAVALSLGPLEREQSETLVANLLGQMELAHEISARIAENAQGNPLFVEEMLRMLIDEEMLEREDGHWRVVGDVAEIGVPPTIEALLGARLDRLQHDQRGTIEGASVIGQEFWRAAVTELSPKLLRRDVPRHLDALTEKELVEPGGQGFAGLSAYHFSHILIRDVAYGGVLKERRSTLHERFAGWLEQHVGERLGEYQEILGYHLEQAYRYRVDLGPVDENGRILAGRAFHYLSVAGGDAHARGDMPASVGLLQRSLSLTEGEPTPQVLELMLKLSQALFNV
jgi:class 3 adenylate cyclase